MRLLDDGNGASERLTLEHGPVRLLSVAMPTSGRSRVPGSDSGCFDCTERIAAQTIHRDVVLVQHAVLQDSGQAQGSHILGQASVGLGFIWCWPHTHHIGA